jgi:hypothetical protein
MQFWMGTVACLGFVGVGLWKRNEKEEFGQLLVGIGSCGLYLAFAAGHVFLHLFGGEVLVGLFLGLSLVNLGYSNATSSRSFLAIGLIGGLAAALMPMRDQNLTLNAVLHFAIVVPAALIVLRKRWSVLALWLWLFSSAALVPAMLVQGPWQLQVFALYANALVCATAYCIAGELGFDRAGLFVPFGLVLSALVGMFWLRGGHAGALHVTLLGVAALALASRLPSREAAKRALAISGAAIPLAIAPWGFELSQSVFIFLTIGIACFVVSLRHEPKAALALGWLTSGLGLVAYGLYLGQGLPEWRVEGAMLAEMIAVAVAGAVALNRSKQSPEWIALGACLVALPFFTRLAYVALDLSPIGAGLYPALLIGWMAFTMFVNVMALRTKWVQPMAASWLTLLLGLVFYVPLAMWSPLGQANDILMLLGLIVTTLVTTSFFRSSRGWRG